MSFSYRTFDLRFLCTYTGGGLNNGDKKWQKCTI